MQIQIDFRSSQPIYVQIIEQIQQMIASGGLKQGDQLPTVRQLAADLRVNFNTIARAYRLLDEAGLISTQQGRGTYIWESPSEESRDELRQHSLQETTKRYLDEAERLDFSKSEITQAFQEELERRKLDQEPKDE
jgi:GntR family transcriptional regulator